MPRAAGIVLFVGLALLVAGTGTAGAAQSQSPPVVQNTTYYLTPDEPDSVRVEITYHLDERRVAGFEVNVSDARTVVRTDGLLRNGEGRYRLAYGATDPSITVEFTPDETIRGSPQTVDAGDWALVDHVDVSARYSGWGRDGSFAMGEGPPVERHTTVAGEGYVGNQYVFLGNHEIAVTEGESQTFVIVLPAAATPEVTLKRVERQLRGLSDAIEVGERDERVVVFVGPDPLYGGGWMVGKVGAANDVIVHETRDASLPGNAWIHEYSHTRQGFSDRGEMWWFTEGFASYYPNLGAYKAGLISYEAFRTKVTPDEDANVVLLRRDDYSHSYSKGRRVMAALDVRVRRASNGTVTLADIVRRMNRREDRVQYPEFKRIVEAVVGTPLDGWIDRHVAMDTAPSVPHAPDLYYTDDRDGDDVPDGLERARGWSTSDPDTDGDGVPDDRERALFLDGTSRDTDGDSLNDGRELELDTDPADADTDGDRLEDGRERELGADPTVSDTDGDTLDDGREFELDTDPTEADTDGDGLGDDVEIENYLDPTATDTDGDGLDDGRERAGDTDPAVPDTDDDTLEDGREVALGTDPTAPDTDGDNLDDGRERELGTDPTAADTDGDDIDDGREQAIGTDPTAADTDGDTLDDGRERELGTDPTAPDTDEDGIDDAEEVRLDTDPTSETGPVAELLARLGHLL
ncbi:MAG: hypothetical protein ABEH35_02065 [Haloarculaceae archaeon]